MLAARDQGARPALLRLGPAPRGPAPLGLAPLCGEGGARVPAGGRRLGRRRWAQRRCQGCHSPGRACSSICGPASGRGTADVSWGLARKAGLYTPHAAVVRYRPFSLIRGGSFRHPTYVCCTVLAFPAQAH